MIDIERSMELKIRIIKHLMKKEEWSRKITKSYLNTSSKELYKERGKRYQDLCHRQFENLLNLLAKENLISKFREGKYWYFRIEELGRKYYENEKNNVNNWISEINKERDNLFI